MALYDKEHIKQLRQEGLKIGISYINDKGLIEFDKAIRAKYLNKKEHNE